VIAFPFALLDAAAQARGEGLLTAAAWRRARKAIAS
jgi:hypothetical protein